MLPLLKRMPTLIKIIASYPSAKSFEIAIFQQNNICAPKMRNFEVRYQIVYFLFAPIIVIALPTLQSLCFIYCIAINRLVHKYNYNKEKKQRTKVKQKIQRENLQKAIEKSLILILQYWKNLQFFILGGPITFSPTVTLFLSFSVQFLTP